MRLGTLRDGSRDGTLIVVDRAARSFARAAAVVPHLQAALDDWDRAAPALQDIAARLAGGALRGEPLDASALLAPLPRAYEWVDGSSYLNHIRLVRKARGADLPENLETEPLVYQGGSGVFLAPTDPLLLTDPDPSSANSTSRATSSFDPGLDFEAEICVVLGDVPRGIAADRAASRVRLLMLANDVTYRGLVAPELKKGFGFFLSKPATGFSPFAVTPDELGQSFHDGRAFLRVETTLNGARVGNLDSGPEMHFSFADLIAYIARTRAFTAGTILGSGTVSNRERSKGVSCLAELRTLETLELGAPRTPFLRSGDTVRIEAFDATGWSVFGAIDQTVRQAGRPGDTAEELA